MHIYQILAVGCFSIMVVAIPIEPAPRMRVQPDTSTLFPDTPHSREFDPAAVVQEHEPGRGQWKLTHQIQSTKVYALLDDIVHLGRSTTLQSFRALDHAYGLLNCHKLADGSKANHGEPCSVQYTQ